MSTPPIGGETVILHSHADTPADFVSVTEPLSKVYSQTSRTSLLGASFDPSFRRDIEGFRAREGYVTPTPKPARRKMYIPNSLWTWSFSIVTLIQTIITLALEWYVNQSLIPPFFLSHLYYSPDHVTDGGPDTVMFLQTFSFNSNQKPTE